MDRAVAVLSFPVHPGPSSRLNPLLSKALMSHFSIPRLCVCPFWLKTFHRMSNLCAFIFLLCHKESSLLLLCPLAACLSNFLFPNDSSGQPVRFQTDVPVSLGFAPSPHFPWKFLLLPLNNSLPVSYFPHDLWKEEFLSEQKLSFQKFAAARLK